MRDDLGPSLVLADDEEPLALAVARARSAPHRRDDALAPPRGTGSGS